MKSVIGIPARLASSRMKRKPLNVVKGTNASILRHVYERCKFARNADYLFVATPDKEIFYHVKSFGGNVILTSPDREWKLIRPGFRVIEAAGEISLDNSDRVITVQGDEPLVHPSDIEKIIDASSKYSESEIFHLYSKCTKKEYKDANEIKVVMDVDGYALYMSRSPIPNFRYSKLNFNEYKMFKQVCIFSYPYFIGRKILEESPTIPELCEEIEMARALSLAYRIKMIYTSHVSKSVDTLDDLAEVEKLMQKDSIYQLYKGKLK